MGRSRIAGAGPVPAQGGRDAIEIQIEIEIEIGSVPDAPKRARHPRSQDSRAATGGRPYKKKVVSA